MPARSRVRDWLEYAGARALITLVSLLPRRAIPSVSRALGSMLHVLLKKRRRVVFDNVKLAYGGAPSAPDPVAISKASFTNVCRSFLEVFRLPRKSCPQDLAALVRIGRGLTFAELRARAGPGPFVFCASHFGAWEIVGAASSLLGEDVTTLVRPLDNRLLDEYLNRMRTRFGQRLASNRGGLRDLLESLASGRSVAVMVDLNMRKKGAVFVDYFGAPAATARTAAVLALRSGRPLVPVFAHRLEKPRRFEVEIAEPIFPDRSRPDRDAETRRLLQEATTAVERRVRQAPGEWLWTHRRWKTRPEGVGA